MRTNYCESSLYSSPYVADEAFQTIPPYDGVSLKIRVRDEARIRRGSDSGEWNPNGSRRKHFAGYGRRGRRSPVPLPSHVRAVAPSHVREQKHQHLRQHFRGLRTSMDGLHTVRFGRDATSTAQGLESHRVLHLLVVQLGQIVGKAPQELFLALDLHRVVPPRGLLHHVHLKEGSESLHDC